MKKQEIKENKISFKGLTKREVQELIIALELEVSRMAKVLADHEEKQTKQFSEYFISLKTRSQKNNPR